ncbi:MAG: hypothetical protein WC484_06860 [Candidatus Omnitrophota bacterium]
MNKDDGITQRKMVYLAVILFLGILGSFHEAAVASADALSSAEKSDNPYPAGS